MLLNNEWVNNKIKEEMKTYLDINENENTMTPNQWDPAKAVLRGKFIVIQVYLKKKTTRKISNNLTEYIFL